MKDLGDIGFDPYERVKLPFKEAFYRKPDGTLVFHAIKRVECDEDVEPDEDFTTAFNKLRVKAKLDDSQLASLLKVTPITIERWVSGKSAPHPFVRPVIFNTLSGCSPIGRRQQT